MRTILLLVLLLGSPVMASNQLMALLSGMSPEQQAVYLKSWGGQQALPSWLPSGYDWNPVDTTRSTVVNYDSDGNPSQWLDPIEMYSAVGPGGAWTINPGGGPQWHETKLSDGGMFGSAFGGLGGVVDSAWGSGTRFADRYGAPITEAGLAAIAAMAGGAALAGSAGAGTAGGAIEGVMDTGAFAGSPVASGNGFYGQQLADAGVTDLYPTTTTDAPIFDTTGGAVNGVETGTSASDVLSNSINGIDQPLPAGVTAPAASFTIPGYGAVYAGTLAQAQSAIQEAIGKGAISAAAGKVILDQAKKQFGSIGQSLGSSIIDQFKSDPASAAFSATPFLLALAEANRQGGDINSAVGNYNSLLPGYQALGQSAQTLYGGLNDKINAETDALKTLSPEYQNYADTVGNSFGDINARLKTLSGGTTGRYDQLLGDVTGNESNFVRAQIDPLLAQQATGYGNLVQGLGARGVNGSSFGNQAITNYQTDTGRSIADATSNALQTSYGLRGNIIGASDAASRAALGLEANNTNAINQARLASITGRQSIGDSALRGLALQGQNAGAMTQANVAGLAGQDQLYSNILKARIQGNLSRNALLGAGLAASGKLFQPTSDPFNLKKLMEDAYA